MRGDRWAVTLFTMVPRAVLQVSAVVGPLLAALLAAATPAAAQVSIAQGDFGEKVEIHVVNVDVLVTDRAGRPVAGLEQKDFELLEDGRPVKITNFALSVVEPVEPAATAGGGPRPAPSATATPDQAVAEEERLHLAVVFDNLHTEPHHRTRILDDLRRFLAGGLAATDRVLLVTYDRGLAVRQPFTSDRAALGRALDGIATLSAHGHELERERRSALETILSTRELITDSGGSPCDPRIAQPVFSYAESMRNEVLRTVGALTLVINSLSGVPGRKALLYVSDGFPVTPGEEMFQVLYEICGGGGVSQGLGSTGPGGAFDSALLNPEDYQGTHALIDAQRYSTVNDLRKLTAHANAQRVTLYTLQASGLRGSASSSAEYGAGERVLQLPSVELVATGNLRNSMNVLAADTGGRAIFDANQVDLDLARMRSDLAAGYSLGFVAEHGGDGKEHRLEVRVKRPGLQVRFPRSYRAKPARERIVDRTLASLFHGVEENPLDLQVLAGEPTPTATPVPATNATGTFRAPIRLRIPLSKLAILTRPDRFEGHLKIYVVARDAEGGTSPMREIDVPIRIPRDQVLTALGQSFAYDIGLTLRPGEHRIALGVHDEYGDVTSYVGTDLRVAAPATAR
jgi:VWFA-related protein